jgi:hypothetical protein
MSAPSATGLPDANAMLTGGGRRFRSLSFKGAEPPVEYRNLTVQAEPETFQDRDDDGTALYWDADQKGKKTTDRVSSNGERNAPIPVYAVKVKLADGFTPSQRVVDEYGEDDGIRYLYFGGRMEKGSRSSFDAIATAIRKGRAKRGLQPGGTIVRYAWVAGGEDTGRTKSTPKEYEAEYDPSTEWPAGHTANGKLARSGGDPADGDYVPPTGPTDGGAYPDDEPPF